MAIESLMCGWRLKVCGVGLNDPGKIVERPRDRTVTVQDSQGRQYAWKSGNGRIGTKRFSLSLVGSNEGVPDGHFVLIPNGQSIASITLDTEDDMTGTRQRESGFRLECSILELRLREDFISRVQELQDLCVVSAIYVLSKERNRLFGGNRRAKSGDKGGETSLSRQEHMWGMNTFPT